MHDGDVNLGHLDMLVREYLYREGLVEVSSQSEPRSTADVSDTSSVLVE